MPERFYRASTTKIPAENMPRRGPSDGNDNAASGGESNPVEIEQQGAGRCNTREWENKNAGRNYHLKRFMTHLFSPVRL